MAQATEKITFAAPAELVAQINQAAEADGCSRSEFLRKAMERYISDREWAEIYRYGEQQAKKMGIKPEDIDDIIHEYREEVAREEESGS